VVICNVNFMSADGNPVNVTWIVWVSVEATLAVIRGCMQVNSGSPREVVSPIYAYTALVEQKNQLDSCCGAE
jgi:hypothetical protein